MATSVTVHDPTRLPDGCRAIPIDPHDREASVRIAVLVGTQPEAHFILLRDVDDAQVFLGCLIDQDQRVLEWLELAVQNVDRLGTVVLRNEQLFNNANLEQRWQSHAEDLKLANPAIYIKTPWETQASSPVCIHKTSLETIYLGEGSTGWVLCSDDSILRQADLPLYTTSLARYLYRPSDPVHRFVPLTQDSVGGASTVSFDEVVGDANEYITFNFQAGLIQVARFSPIGHAEYADLLSGKSWEGIPDGAGRLDLAETFKPFSDWETLQRSEGYLFSGQRGRSGRLAEIFYLKLNLLLQALRELRQNTQRNQLPLLNVTHDSFRVRFGDPQTGLPFLWTAKCGLVRQGQTHPITVETTQERFYVRTGDNARSIFHPDGREFYYQGLGELRVRSFSAEKSGYVIQGTLSVREQIQVSPNDLFWLRVPLSTGRVDVYGHIYLTERMTRGELPFRSVPQKIPEQTVALLKQGFKFPGCVYEVIPLLSSPFDLYSFGVLSIMTLLVNEQNSVQEATDEILSLARDVAGQHNPDVPLAARIATLVNNDSRWLASLGPHCLTRESITPEEAAIIIPAPFWNELLGWLVTLFPGKGPDSCCQDLGDAPPTALETVYDEPLERLTTLCERVRGLIVNDAGMNAEIHAIVDKLIEQETF